MSNESVTLQDVSSETPALIHIKQLPIIEEHLRAMQEEVQKTTQEAMSLVCSPETIQSVKSARSDLKKKFDTLEAQRKAVKFAIIDPYNKFEAVYRECVSDAFRDADENLKQKISAVESSIIAECEAEMVEYFAELTAAEHLEWLAFDRTGIKIGLTEARQKSHPKQRKLISEFVSGVSNAVSTINGMDHAEEIMVEYKRSLSLSDSINSVNERYRRIEEERQRKEAWEARKKAEREAVAKVDAVIPAPVPTPAPVAAPVPAPEPVSAPSAPAQRQGKDPNRPVCIKFTIHTTAAKALELRNYMEKEGIRYE